MRQSGLKEDFTVREVALLAKLTPHMVNYLCRNSLLEPSASIVRSRGVYRRFSYADLLMARAIARLLEAGVSVLALKKAFDTLRIKIEGVPIQAFARRQVAIAGNQVYLAQPGQPPVNLTAGGQLAFHFVLNGDDLPIRRTTGQARVKRPRKRAA